MMRVAAVDCGTNSVRLLVADVDPADGVLVDVERRMEITRLGQGVDRTGNLDPDALARTLAALEAYRDIIRRAGAGRVRVAATSATRDAANRALFIRGVEELFGMAPEVLTGEEEAALSYDGATRDLAALALPSPYLVVDIGGGSTEFVLGDGAARSATSVDIGSVRLTERQLRADPPTRAQVDAAAADIEAALDQVEAAVPLRETATLVGVAGTTTTVTGLVLGLDRYDPDRIHHARIAAGDVHAVAERLLRMRHEERAAMRVIHPGRVDVIGAGALLLSLIVRRLGLDELVVSEHDILDGLAWSVVGVP